MNVSKHQISLHKLKFNQIQSNKISFFVTTTQHTLTYFVNHCLPNNQHQIIIEKYKYKTKIRRNGLPYLQFLGIARMRSF